MRARFCQGEQEAVRSPGDAGSDTGLKKFRVKFRAVRDRKQFPSIHFTSNESDFDSLHCSRIADNLEEQLPSLETLILTNNTIGNLGDLDALSTVKTLRFLSVLKNPVALKKHYRLYIIYRIPQLRILDFKRIKLAVS